MGAALSLEPLLALLGTLARDLQADFMPFIPRIFASFGQLVDQGDPPSPFTNTQAHTQTPDPLGPTTIQLCAVHSRQGQGDVIVAGCGKIFSCLEADMSFSAHMHVQKPLG